MNETGTMRWPGSSGPHPLNLLPSEIRGEIFNKLKQPEAYKLRLVCKQWNEDVKDFYNFDIDFNEDSPGLDFILKLRIVKLKVRKLVQNRFRILPVPEAEVLQLRSGRVLQKGLHNVTFKYPNCLRRVIISYFSLSKHQDMPANALKEILQLCQKSVTHLKLRLDSPMFIYRFQSTIRFQFRNLKRLDLKFDIKTAGLFQNDSILHSLKTSRFPSLSYLKANFSSLDNISKTGIVVAFILTLLTKNPKGLEQVSLDMYHYQYSLNTRPEVLAQAPAPEEVPDLESLKTVTDLKQIKFFVHFLEASTNMKLLLQLLPRQRVLEKLYLGIKFECSPTLLSTILLNNSETIVDVNIRILNVNSEAPFDISVLKNCQKLKRLCLHRNFDNVFPPVGSGPEFLNCRDFPASLTNLSFEGVRILSLDLVALLQSDLLLSLEELWLSNCGDSGDCGINLTVLKKLGRLKTKIKKNLKLMKMNFGRFNCSWLKEEVGKLKATLRKLGTGDESFRRWLLRDDDDDEGDGNPADPPALEVRWCRKAGSAAGLWSCSAQGWGFRSNNFFGHSENSE